MSTQRRIGDIGHGAGPGSAHLEQRLESAARADAPEALLRTLDDVIQERRLKGRDCRECKNFERHESGLNYGWCSAHEQHVKLYHPAGEWFSQCLFKGIRRFKPQEFERARILAERERSQGATPASVPASADATLELPQVEVTA